MKAAYFKKNISIIIVWLAILTVSAKQPKYIFYCIGDGMGMNQVEGTEFYLSSSIGDVKNRLLFTQFPSAGFATTYSSSHYITCSAAAGTALATGVKTKNNTVGVNHEGNPVYSLITKAQSKGWKTAIVTSVSINDATPAAFYAHQKSRSSTYEIAIQAAESKIDFLGCAGFKVANEKVDQSVINLYEYFKHNDYSVIKGKLYTPDLMTKKILMVPENDYPGIKLPYAIDRNESDMELGYIVTSALDFLQQDKPDGFFMVIEGGQIDHAAHAQDAATVFKEIVDFNNNIRLIYDFYKNYPDETLIVVTADHDTGGMGLGVKNTTLNLQVLKNQQVSVNKLTSIIRKLRKDKGSDATWEDVESILRTNLGFWDTVEITQDDEVLLKECYRNTFGKKDVKGVETLYAKNDPLSVLAIEIINRIAQVGWTTNSHTAAPVPVYSIGVGSDSFTGRMDNTDIQKRILKLIE